MARRTSPKTALANLFDGSTSPIYVLDRLGQIVYCNRALSVWTGVVVDELVGRQVAYHSVDEPGSLPGIAAGLCPPPAALDGLSCAGHVSCQTHQGRLVYRLGHFEPLAGTEPGFARTGVVAVLSADDLTPDKVTTHLLGDADSDTLHAAIRRFRRHQAEKYDLASLVGESVAMRTIRRQVEMAAATTVPVTILGLAGSGREHIARAIHYNPPYDAKQKFVVHDGPAVDADELRWSIEALHGDGRVGWPCTLLIREVNRAPIPVQQQLLGTLSEKHGDLRVIVTTTDDLRRQAVAENLSQSHAGSLPRPSGNDATDSDGIGHRQFGNHAEPLPRPSGNDATDSHGIGHKEFDTDLAITLSALVIEVPPLSARREDLPLLAQYFVEECNRDRPRQIGGLGRDAVELLALYAWPRGIGELRDVVRAAHAQASQFEISAADLPTVVHHAASDVGLPKRRDKPLVLDQFLARIERELIQRALSQAQGNKTRAAELLGMTRQRFYRRLVQLGLD